MPSTFVLKEDVLHEAPAADAPAEDIPIPKGTVVDLEDCGFTVYTAEAILVSGDRRLFRYDGWSSKFDEWVSVDSPRIFPRNTFTPPGRSAGVGTGVYHPPAPGTRVVIQQPGTLNTEPGTIVVADENSLTAKFDPPHDDRPPVSVSVPLPWGVVAHRPIISTPSAEDIARGVSNLRVGQMVDAVDEHYNAYTAVILDIDLTCNAVYLMYSTFDEETNAWTSCARIAPLHTYTEHITSLVQTDQGIRRVGVVPVPPPVGTKVHAVKWNGNAGKWECGRITELVDTDGAPNKIAARVVFESCGTSVLKYFLTSQVQFRGSPSL